MKTIKHVKNFEGFTINESTQDQFMLAMYQRGESGYICIKESTLAKLGFTPKKNPAIGQETTIWSSPEVKYLEIWEQQNEKFATPPILLGLDPAHSIATITKEQAYAILKAGGVFNPNGGLFEFKLDDRKNENAVKLAESIFGFDLDYRGLGVYSFFVWMPAGEGAIISNPESWGAYWSPKEVSLEDFLADENY
jgi:hypothetical protein